MSDLEESLKAYNDNLALANLNLDDVPRNVRPGRESQKMTAVAAIDGLRKSYGDQLRKASFGIAVTGPGTEEFVKIAQEEADVIVVDALGMYRRIADRVAQALGATRDFGVSHYSAVIAELRQIAAELDVFSMPSPKWTEAVSIGDEQGLLNHIRSMVDSSVGLDLGALYISRQITEKGLAAGSSKATVPVLLTGLDTASAEALLPKVFHEGRSTLVTTTSDVNKEFVLDAFNKVKKQIKTSKKN